MSSRRASRGRARRLFDDIRELDLDPPEADLESGGSSPVIGAAGSSTDGSSQVVRQRATRF